MSYLSLLVLHFIGATGGGHGLFVKCGGINRKKNIRMRTWIEIEIRSLPNSAISMGIFELLVDNRIAFTDNKILMHILNLHI